MTARIRPATSRDFAAVSTLLAELGRPVVHPGDPDHEAAFASYLARLDTAALVAEDEDVVVGFIDVEFRQRLNVAAPQAWIPDLIVTEAARSVGVGASLLAAAEDLARERGCFGMELESASWRTRAHAFYRREGWSETALAFSKSLGDTPWPPAPRP
jgi:GNAT superfamily N-acetyltransferase